MHLYTHILFNLDKLPNSTINSILYEHELTCLARMVKYKFKDKRSVLQILNIIKDTYKLSA